MELRHLRCFVAVAEDQPYDHQRLLAQPPLSRRQIQDLQHAIERLKGVIVESPWSRLSATEIAGDGCKSVLEALVSEGYLTRVHDGGFCRRSEP
jgi:hypothetical protein